MGSDIVYLSAPHDVRRIGQADIAWEALRRFQPLLGQDAQMAGFAAVARLDGVPGRGLAAPEIYGEGVALDRLLGEGGGRVLAHVRFGSPRLPRILKRFVNMVVLAEDITIPTRLGRHPFAAGAALPAHVDTVFVYSATTPLPERSGAKQAAVVVLPPGVAEADLLADQRQGGITLQSCAEFRGAAWQRSASPDPVEGLAEELARSTAVLLPWNLAAPGCLVPNVLEKASLLAAQRRFPLTIVVLPYNDVPGSLALMEETVASCAELLAEQADGMAILWARAGSIGESFRLLQRCRRAWIDTADPEWRWTLDRISACGLPVNFISSPPTEVAAMHNAGPFAPDELITKQLQGLFGQLFWRTRVLSLRRLARLAEAVERGTDAPFRPVPPEPAGSVTRPTLQDMLRSIEPQG